MMGKRQVERLIRLMKKNLRRGFKTESVGYGETEFIKLTIP